MLSTDICKHEAAVATSRAEAVCARGNEAVDDAGCDGSVARRGLGED